MQNIQTKEDVKQAAHRLHRKMKSLLPGANLSQAQEALASVFGMRNFDSLMGTLPSADDLTLNDAIGVKWVYFEDGKAVDDDIIDSCYSEAELQVNLVDFSLSIQHERMGGEYRMFKMKQDEDYDWHLADEAPLAIFKDCMLIGGSREKWLRVAMAKKSSEQGVRGEAGAEALSFTRHVGGLEVWLLGFYSKNTPVSGYDYYCLADKNKTPLPMSGHVFEFRPSPAEAEEALRKAGHLPKTAK